MQCMVKVRTNYIQERKIHIYKSMCFEYMKILDVPLKVKKNKNKNNLIKTG